jgi:hypothetical protein
MTIIGTDITNRDDRRFNLYVERVGRVAVRICDLGKAQLAVEKVMGRRKETHALGDQGADRRISILGPENDFDRAPFPFGMKAVVLSGRFYCRNSESEPIQSELDVDGLAQRGSAKRLQQSQVQNRTRPPEEDLASRDL